MVVPSSSSSKSRSSRAMMLLPKSPTLVIHRWVLFRISSELLFCKLDDLVEPARVVDGDLRQRLPIELALPELQSVHELAVTQAASPARRVDADDPQPTKLAFAHTAIAE